MSDDRQLHALLTRAADTVGEVTPPGSAWFQKRHRRRRRVVTVVAPAIAALVVAAVAVSVAVVINRGGVGSPQAANGPTTSHPTGSSTSPAATPQPSVGVADLRGYRWGTLPAAPIRPRVGAAGVWTGHELLVWGGGRHATGASYDPATRRWRVLPRSPLSARSDPAYAWTGSQLFVWGGSSGSKHLTDGALYDPVANQWTALPSAPIDSYGWAGAYPVGGGVVLVSTAPGRTSREIRADVYEPGSNTWRALPSVHLSADRAVADVVALAAGTRLYVWSLWSYSSRTHEGGTVHNGVQGYTLDPAAGRWQRNDFAPQQVIDQPQWTGTDILMPTLSTWCYGCPIPMQLGRSGLSIDTRTGSRTKIPHGPVSDLGPTWLWTGAALLGVDTTTSMTSASRRDSPGEAAAWNPTSGAWVRLRSAPYAGDDAVTVWTGHSVLIWGPLYTPRGGHTDVTGLEFAAPRS